MGFYELVECGVLICFANEPLSDGWDFIIELFNN
jgi:hypothetical protein